MSRGLFKILFTYKIIIMRKANLVNRIAEKTGIPKVDVLVTLESFFKEVKGSLVEGEPIFIRGFGSFIVKKRAAKMGRIVKKNIPIEIPEHFLPVFKPADEFKDMVKKHCRVETHYLDQFDPS